MKENGLREAELRISPSRSSRHYPVTTHENRAFETWSGRYRKICRKVVKSQVLLKPRDSRFVTIQPKSIEKYLGVRRFRYGKR